MNIGFRRFLLSVGAAAALLAPLAGCSESAPSFGTAESAYGEATRQASGPGTAKDDLRALQQNRQNDEQVINDASRAVGSIGR